MKKKEAIKLLSDDSRLSRDFPEIATLGGCPQKGPFHGEGDVLAHTRIVVANLPDGASSELVWAGILHDIAKPLTISERERGGEVINQFFKHEVVGADLAAEILSRQGIADDVRDKVWWLIRHHMRIASLPQMRAAKAREFATHHYFPELVELFKADVRGSESRTEDLHAAKEGLIAEVEGIYRLINFK